jgi:hypothetical protein
MITGRCLCGVVRYEIDGKISSTWLCHCSKCRRTTGSAFHAGAICRAENFRWVAGEASIREFEESPGYKVRFCSRCGTPVPAQLAGSDRTFLHVGGLDGAPNTKLSHHIFTGSKACWWEITDGLPEYEEHVPGTEI